MPARKAAGAPKAAASKIRLIVRPPELTAITEPGSPDVVVSVAPAAATDGALTHGVKPNGFPTLIHDAQGEKVAKISSPTTLKSSSDSSDGAGTRRGNIAKGLVPRTNRIAVNCGRSLLFRVIPESASVF